MLIGYARVSTTEQNLDLQYDALRAAGAGQIFADRGVSGAAVFKPEFSEALRLARPGDVIVVWKFDRLSRNLRHLLEIVEDFERRGLDFRSITEAVDTSTPIGRVVFSIIGALAQFEREQLIQRTREGITAARSRGKTLGRPPSISPERWENIKAALLRGDSIPTVAGLADVTRQAIYDRLGREISDENFADYRAQLARGADRDELIKQMGLFAPALRLREARFERAIARLQAS